MQSWDRLELQDWKCGWQGAISRCATSEMPHLFIAGDSCPGMCHLPVPGCCTGISQSTRKDSQTFAKLLFPPFSALCPIPGLPVPWLRDCQHRYQDGRRLLVSIRKIWYLLLIILSHSNYPGPKKSLVMQAGSLGTDCTSPIMNSAGQRLGNN